MRVLVACEFSGIVRNAFAARGHDAWSCDLLSTEIPGQHHVGDVIEFIKAWPHVRDPLTPWDILIAFPPCTYLCNSGVRWLQRGANSERMMQMWEAAKLFNDLLAAPIGRIAIENPVMHSYARERVAQPYSQIIHPWQFGHGETKQTCLWLKNLPPLQPAEIVDGRVARVHRATPGPDRWKERSRTLPGIATAMAAQWG